MFNPKNDLLMKRFYLPLIIMMSFALVLSACKKDDEDDDKYA